MTTILKIEFNNMINNFIGLVQTKFLVLIIFLGSFFAPVVPFVITTFIFIILDTVTGFFKARYKKTHNSNDFKRGFVPKVVIYTFVITAVFIADKLICNELIKSKTQFEFAITKIVALILIFIESWSIDENFKEIYGVSIIAKFKVFLKRITSFMNNNLDNQNKKNENK